MTQEACARCGAPRAAAATPFCTNCGTPFAASQPSAGAEPPTMMAGGSNPAPAPGWGPPGMQQPPPGMPPQGGQWGPPPGGPMGPGGPGGPGGQWAPGPPNSGGGGGFNARIAIIVGLVVLLLAGGGIAAAVVLGGDDDDDSKSGKDAPTSASEEEFCKQWETLDSLDEDDAEDFEKAKQLFVDLGKLGTPEDMPAEAREGFEVYLDFAKSLDSPEDTARLEDEVTAEQGQKMQAFFVYMAETCTGLSEGDDPIETPTGAPTLDIDPSEFPSFNPSDMPSIDPSDFGLDEDSLRELESQLSELASPR